MGAISYLFGLYPFFKSIDLIEIGMLGDVLLARCDLIAHEQCHQMLDICGIIYRDLNERTVFRVQSGLPELFGVHLTEALISLEGIAFEALCELVELRIVIGIEDLLALLHLIERRHAHVDVTACDEFARIAVEEGKEQCPYMRAVLICIGKDDDLIIF